MKLTAWGRYPRIMAQGRSFESLEPLRRYVQSPDDYIVYGAGRSYGDCALNHRVIFSRHFDKILHFDPREGMVTCESGVTLAEVLEVFLPRGWLPAVLPGTRWVTVGGAIASDIHGKNHHRYGCFSESVHSLDLLLPEGEVVRCGRDENRPLFLATCGGMGLTGVILSASFQLKPVASAYIRERTIPCANLEETLQRCEEHQDATYSVAWIDALAHHGNLGRAILKLGEHAEGGGLTLPVARSYTVPLELPAFGLNRYALALFNHLFYRKHGGAVEERLTSLEEFFFPLDSIRNWNRLYGPRGFTQYQVVLPKPASLTGLREILARSAASGLPPFLGVLKLCGPENDNLLSFPLEGYTLALDFKIQPSLFPVLAELDRIVADHGGRLYLAKDVRMSREVFRQIYPRWEQFVHLRESYGIIHRFNSLQSRRLGL